MMKKKYIFILVIFVLILTRCATNKTVAPISVDNHQENVDENDQDEQSYEGENSGNNAQPQIRGKATVNQKGEYIKRSLESKKKLN